MSDEFRDKLFKGGDVVGGHETISRLKRAFKHVDDVDLFILGLAEKPLRGALVGSTFSCIISLQFQKKTTMAQVICDNIDRIGQVQPMAFQMGDDYE
uniref:Uncharacterized protein n=1 Tax=Parascaris equorum TaxID=6256 RepID=A0A914R849_PAREQ